MTDKIDWTKYNCYLEVCAPGEAYARGAAQPNMIGDEPLVHIEPPTEEGEWGHYVFACWNDVLSDFDDWTMLHDHYVLPDLPNMPIETID